MMNQLLSLFENPTAAYRSKPFWAWNAQLEETELRRQIRIFKQMGFGGFFMHSRVGLQTPYLSDEWFDLCRTCVDEAQHTQHEAWLYDEDRWPSGSAGGLVTKDPAYRQRSLKVTRITDVADYTGPADALATHVFAARLDGDKLLSYRRLEDPSQLAAVPSDEELIQFTLELAPCHSWYNGYTYLDTLSVQAVQKFIETTHEPYRRELGQHFGKTIPGIFTDEPNHGAVWRTFWKGAGHLPWTETLPQQFQEMFGYDVIEKLPELAFDPADRPFSQPRYHYHRCKTRMFVEAFSKQIGAWCDQNDLLLTGHVLEEHPVSANVSMVGAAMQFYTYMQAPGIDLLTQYKMEYLSVKQCASVARQMGRRWVLSELYGCTGWETTFETYKHSGDWQAALGINLRCPHLSWYSMAGAAKRDYPASIHFQSPWYRQYARIEDYFARLNTVLTAGAPVCDLAVIHPVESLYLLFSHALVQDDDGEGFTQITDADVKERDQQCDDLIRWLLGNHLDFDFADEELLVELDAAVESDQHGPCLRIGAMRYRAVLVPPLITIRQTTLDVLKRFAEAGGVVQFAGDAPTCVDALPNDAPQAFAADRSIPFDADAVVAAVQDHTRRVHITYGDAQGSRATDIFYQLRNIDGNWALFLNNNNREHACEDLHVRLDAVMPADAQVQLWDAFTGDRYALDAALTENSAAVSLDLPPSGSALIQITTRDEDLPAAPAYLPTGSETPLAPDRWDYALDAPNVLVLDRCDAVVVNEQGRHFTKKQTEILDFDDQLRDWLKLERRGGQMTQPWAAQDRPLGATAQITLTYTFNVRSLPTGALALALEQPDEWTIMLNGCSLVADQANGWWVDRCLQTIPVDPAVLKRGKNTLTLKARYDRRLNLEIVYLLGHFGVKAHGRKAAVTKLPTKLTLGDWTKQGLPFYSGNVIYRHSFAADVNDRKRYALKLPGYQAAAVEVSINNSPFKMALLRNAVLDITDDIKTGPNTLDLRLLGSRRNAFGPLHLSDPAPLWTGPEQFARTKPELWQDEFNLHPYGLTAPPVLVEHD